MTLRLVDKWIWDFWFARDGEAIHIFYLQAPRSLGDANIRHWHTSIGHAVSNDLIHWEVLPDALTPSKAEGTWDDYTTWTGSIIKQSSTWFMFYTGTKRSENGKIQRIGLATSDDLIHWKKHAGNPIMEIDPQWYELLDLDVWYEEVWRDPWVFEFGGRFHAFITARSKAGAPDGRGVIGHVVSDDLLNWQTQGPITEAGEFGYLEVPQLIHENGMWYLFFSSEQSKFSQKRLNRKSVKQETGTHYLVSKNPLGPYQFLSDDFLCGDDEGSFYSGKVIQHPQGEWVLMTCHQFGGKGQFVGEIANPMRIKFETDKLVKLTDSKNK